MTLNRCQVIIHTEDNVPANYATNTWYFDIADASGRLAASNAVYAFYASIDTYYGSQVAQNGHEVKWYNMDDPEPRAPVLEATFNFDTNPTSNPIPQEVACCVSFQAARASGQSQARRRGRVYIGPLGTNALAGDARPATAFITQLETAAQALLDASDAATDWYWVVYSTVNADFVTVANGWIDNTFDTQRRRGVPYTTRTLFA